MSLLIVKQNKPVKYDNDSNDKDEICMDIDTVNEKVTCSSVA